MATTITTTTTAITTPTANGFARISINIGTDQSKARSGRRSICQPPSPSSQIVRLRYGCLLILREGNWSTSLDPLQALPVFGSEISRPSAFAVRRCGSLYRQIRLQFACQSCRQQSAGQQFFARTYTRIVVGHLALLPTQALRVLFIFDDIAVYCGGASTCQAVARNSGSKKI